MERQSAGRSRATAPSSTAISSRVKRWVIARHSTPCPAGGEALTVYSRSTGRKRGEGRRWLFDPHVKKKN
eukprot:3779519-Rhodomonas_salina.2